MLAAGGDFLHVAACHFIANGMIFVCSSAFQALGQKLPALLSSANELLTFGPPAVWLSTQPSFSLHRL